MNIRENKGITLITLTITIIVLIIISTISITGLIRGEEDIQISTQFYELSVIQHAILERYTKVQLTKGELPGNLILKSDVQLIIDEINTISGSNIQLKGNDTDYKELNEQHLKELGINQETDTFIVNYKTGEVINKTLQVSDDGKPLYIFAKNAN